jgi:hypothetical protein
LIDFIFTRNSNRQKQFILTCKDIFSKKVWLEPLHTKAIGDPDKDDLGDSIIVAVRKIIQRNNGNYPHRIQTDRGVEFRDRFSDWLRDELDVTHVLSSAYKPTSQGQVERSNRVVKELLRKHFLLNNTLNWVDVLRDVEDNINNSVHAVTLFSPNVAHGFVPGSQEAAREIVHERLKQYAEKLKEKRGKVPLNELKKKFLFNPVRITRDALMRKGLLSKKAIKGPSKALLTPFWTDETFM